MLPFVTRWKAYPVQMEVALDELAAPPARLGGGAVRTYVDAIFNLDGFVNEHPNWVGKHGLAFSARSGCRSDKLEVLMGYDGPFRLWIDGEPFFTDMLGQPVLCR